MFRRSSDSEDSKDYNGVVVVGMSIAKKPVELKPPHPLQHNDELKSHLFLVHFSV